MPIHTVVDIHTGVVVHTLQGTLEIQEAFQAFDSQFDLPDYQPGMPAVWGFRQADVNGLSADEVRKYAQHTKEYHQAHGTHYKIAIVMDQQLLYGFARMFEMAAVREAKDFCIFENIEDARAWFNGAQINQLCPAIKKP
jgi:hypothetical protein